MQDLSEENFIKLDNKRISEILYYNNNKLIQSSDSLVLPIKNLS